MARGVAVARRVDDLDELGRADAGAPGEHAEQLGLGLHRVADDEVDLGAVAGRDRDRLARRSSRATSSRRNALGLALGQRDALAQRDRRGLVRDAEGEQLAHARLRARARGSLGALVGELVELAQLALDARQLRGHDRDVDQDQREEDEVRGGDVAGVVGERVGAHELGRAPGRGAAAARVAGPSPAEPAPQRAQLRAACLAVISYFHSVTKSSAIPSERGEEGELHLARQVAAGRVEHARVDAAARPAARR